jgi:putative ABC transport system ATP-binding protein
MTALENVALPLEFSEKTDARARAEEVLQLVGLSHRLDHFPSQLSGGEQQRVAIARALAPNPKLIFADEPTGNLDAKNGDQIMDLLFSLHQRLQTTLVLVTHDKAIAARCERVIHLDDGRIAAETAGRVLEPAE